MLIVTKRRYKKQHVIGGAGIFDTIASVIKRLFTSNAAKQIASTALSVGKDAAKEIGKKALDVGKTAAIDAGKRLVDKAAAKLLTPKNQEVITQLTGLQPQPAVNIQKTKDILTSLIDDGTTNFNTNINSLLAGSGIAKPRIAKPGMKRYGAVKGNGASNASKAIAIQDLVKRLATPASMLNGAGMKVV